MKMQNFGEKPTFGGHEKFPLRYGWLKKGVDATLENNAIFSHDQALVKLGVGKNMVRSIRHWCLATNLLEETEGASVGRVKPLQPTTLAKHFVLEKGWDCYLEDIGSYWLIHWELISNKHRALVWHILFAQYHHSEFTKQQFIAFCERYLEDAGIKTTAKMIEREVDCCLRTYITMVRSSKTTFSEDSLDCPLTELELLRFVPADNVYNFNIGPKLTLPVHVFGYALFMFLRPFASTRRTLAIDDCLYHSASPGQVFKLDENSLVNYLEELEGLTKGKLRLQESGGLRQIYLDEGLIENTVKDGYTLLDSYYE